MHWTYESFCAEDDLCQGDILEPNEELTQIFNKVHPHFTDNKYYGFLLLTQTCDLVKRNGKCGATHISLSVIRSLKDIIKDSLKSKFGYLSPGVYNAQQQVHVKSLIERIINQNENKLALFYLHPNLDSGITIPSVAILRVSILLQKATVLSVEDPSSTPFRI